MGHLDRIGGALLWKRQVSVLSGGRIGLGLPQDPLVGPECFRQIGNQNLIRLVAVGMVG